jgi:hypothetical protein
MGEHDVLADLAAVALVIHYREALFFLGLSRYQDGGFSGGAKGSREGG